MQTMKNSIVELRGTFCTLASNINKALPSEQKIQMKQENIEDDLRGFTPDSVQAMTRDEETAQLVS